MQLTDIRPLRWLLICATLGVGAMVGVAAAAALPEERADLLFHIYEGGGQTVEGPAVSVRKNFRAKASLNAGYTIDDISGASIDVVTSATAYQERRTEYNIGGDWLHRDTLISASYSTSSENDYDAETVDFGVSQDFFGGMSTVSLGVGFGDDQVGRVDSDFSESRTRNNYRASLTQVLSPTLIATLAYEGIADEGYLQNPYRSARVLGAAVPELYPSTLSSAAYAVQLLKLWKPWFSTRLSYRHYSDSWQLSGDSLGLTLSQTVLDGMLLDLNLRYYKQDAASFYADDFSQPQTYMARDKELSSFDSQLFGMRLTLPIRVSYTGLLRRAAVTIGTDYMQFNYDDFTDLRTGNPYSFDAAVVQVYFSAFY